MFCRALDWIKAHWSIVAGTLTFACSAPFLFVSLGESAFVSKGMFLLVFMSLSWALMPWSIFVTSLFPLVLLPVLGLSPASKAASLYFNDAIALFLGSFIMTAAMERWQLHRRLALRLICVFKSPVLVLAAVMCSTALLSMFISNTSTAALMVSLVLPILKHERPEQTLSKDSSLDQEEPIISSDDIPLDGASSLRGEANSKYGRSLLLAVAYGSSLGGIGTLVGTGPNLALVQILANSYKNFPGLSFGLWSAFAIPIVTMSLICLFGVLFLWNRRSLKHVVFPIAQYRQELDSLGSISFEEVVVLVGVMLEVVLWLSRTGFPPSVPGWGSHLFSSYVQDGTICMFVSILFFLIPSKSRLHGLIVIISIIFPHGKSKRPHEQILPASAIGDLHWDVILLLGAGFAIGDGFSKGLTSWIGTKLQSLRVVPSPIVVVILALFTSFFTEVCSNVASAVILLPICGSLAMSLGENPLLFMVPVTISCSLAFCLPVATPPNALVVSTGLVGTKDMLRIGIMFNFLCAGIVSGWTLLGSGILGVHLGDVPAWANVTMT